MKRKLRQIIDGKYEIIDLDTGTIYFMPEEEWDKIQSCYFCQTEVTDEECSSGYTCAICLSCAKRIYTEGD